MWSLTGKIRTKKTWQFTAEVDSNFSLFRITHEIYPPDFPADPNRFKFARLPRHVWGYLAQSSPSFELGEIKKIYPRPQAELIQVSPFPGAKTQRIAVRGQNYWYATLDWYLKIETWTGEYPSKIEEILPRLERIEAKVDVISDS